MLYLRLYIPEVPVCSNFPAGSKNIVRGKKTYLMANIEDYFREDLLR